VTGLVLGLGSFALVAPAALADWLAISRYFTGDYATYPSNQSMRGFLLRAFAGGPRHVPLVESRLLADGLWVVAAIGALVLWWRCVSGRRAGGDRRAVAEYALTAALMLFAAPLSEDVHYVALLLPLAVLADRAAWGPAPARWTALAVVACLYFLQPWLDFAYNRGGTDLRRLLASGAYLYGLLLVGGALVTLLWGRAPKRRDGSNVSGGEEAAGVNASVP
jgi:hypothetical protein